MKISKRLKSLISISVIVLLLLGAGVALKNIFLHQIKKKIQSSFDYTRLYMSFFPPSIILENVRTRSLSPFFSAKKIEVRISYRSLLTKERPLNVFIERPILRIYRGFPEKDRTEKTEFRLSFPFSIEKGLIRAGELYIWSNEFNFQSKEIKALFTQKKGDFSFQAEAGENILSLASVRQPIEGEVSLSFEGRDEKINVKRIKVNSSDFILKAEGSVLDPLDPELMLETSLKVRTPLIVDLFNLPFEWEGKTEGKGILTRREGSIAFKGDFSSNGLILNRVFMGKVEGRIDFSEKEGGTVELNTQRRSFPREFVRIHFTKGKIEGIVRGFHLDPIINYVSLPWPVVSPVWGSFTIDGGVLQADAEFRDKNLSVKQGKFPFHGRVRFNWDGKSKISFSSEELTSSFAHVEVKGEANINQNLDLAIKGEVSDVREARQFTSLILRKSFGFPEIRGKGRAELRIFGDYDSPQVQADFTLSPGGFDKFEAASVEGNARIVNNEFSGRFRIDDPFMEGKITLLTNQDGVRAGIQLERGYVERILPALDINLPLQGQASGNFELKQKDEDIQLKGSFSSSEMKLAEQNLKEVRGRLEWQGDSFSLPEIQFNLHKGKIRGSGLVRPSSKDFDISIQGERVDLSSLYSGITGNLGFNLKGKGVFGQDFASGRFEIKELHFSPFQKTEAKGEAKLGYSEGKLNLELDGSFLPGENEFHISFAFPINEEPFSADIRGNFTNLDLLLPWKGAKGRVNYLGEIKVQESSPQIKGAIDFQGPVFPLPRFAHAIRDYSGLMFVENGKIYLRSLQAKLGGGDVRGSGEIELGQGGVKNINLKMEGQNLLLSPLERTRALVDGSLNLIKDTNRFVLSGNFLVRKLSWRRELNEKFVFYSRPYYESRREPGFFNDLTLNIRLKADDNAWMENSLGRVRGRFDLTINGNVNALIVLGDIEALGGDVYFQDRKFRILGGRLSFFNPLTIEPYLSFKGETYVKDYRVTFSLDGLLDHLSPEFSSSPPLPPEDVLALLALGESFKRTYSYDTSTQLSTASLLSFQISEEAKRRAEGLFSIDRFRIDPFIMGSSAEMTARLTVGKKISRNFFILYSTNLTAQKEEIARIEWELTNDFSIVGIRDEKGRISIDVKIHKRF